MTINNKVSIFNILELENQKADYGGLKRYSHPKMRSFVSKTKFSGELFLDLKKSVIHFENLFHQLKEIHKNGQKILFVGTNPSTKNMLGNHIQNTGHFFIDNKWSGGLLTNFRTLQKRVFNLQNKYNQIDKGLVDNLTKKEKLDFQDEKKILEKNLKGIMEMQNLPNYLFIIDPFYHKIACQEALKLNIPIFALLKTNFNPDLFKAFVPINTDSALLLEKIMSKLVEFCFDKPKPKESVQDSEKNFSNSTIASNYKNRDGIEK